MTTADYQTWLKLDAWKFMARLSKKYKDCKIIKPEWKKRNTRNAAGFYEGSGNPLAAVNGFMISTRNKAPLRWLCARFGGHFVVDQQHFRSGEARHREWFSTARFLMQLKNHIIDAYELENGIRHYASNEKRFSNSEVSSICFEWLRVYSFVESQIQDWEERPKKHKTENWDEIQAPPGFRGHVKSWEAFLRSKDFHRTARMPTNKDIGENGESHFQMVAKWCKSPSANGNKNPLDSICDIIYETKSYAPLFWLCEKNQGFFFIEDINPKIGDVFEDWERAFWELAEVEAVITKNLRNETISPQTLSIIKKEWRDAKEWMANFIETICNQ